MRIHLYTRWNYIDSNYRKGVPLKAWSKEHAFKGDVHIDVSVTDIIEHQGDGFYLIRGRDYGYD